MTSALPLPSSMSTADTLGIIRRMLPPTGLALIGAGNGAGVWAEWILAQRQVPTVLVEADGDNVKQLKRLCMPREDINVVHAVVAPASADDLAFHRLSIDAESGLMAPDKLRGIWPNLQLRGVQRRSAVGLGELLEQHAGVNWLFIDCLSSDDMLAAATTPIDRLDLILLRRAMNPTHSNLTPDSARDFDAYMATRGFLNLGKWPQRHPLLVHELWVRDVAHANRQIASKLLAEQDHLGAKLQSLTAQRDETARQAQAIEATLDETQAAFAKAIQAQGETIDLLTAEQSAHQFTKSVLQQSHEQITRLEADARSNANDRDRLVQQARSIEAALEESRATLADAIRAQGETADLLATERAAHQTTMSALVLEKEHVITLGEASQNARALQAKLDQSEACLMASTDQVTKLRTDITRLRERTGDLDEFVTDLKHFFQFRSLSYADVGAFKGEVFQKLVDASGLRLREAHLFEPNPDSYEALQTLVANAHTQCLHLYPLAISAQAGTLTLSMATSMSKVIEGPAHVGNASHVVEVPCKTLDDLAHHFTDRRLDVLKIDVEGHELAVLAGASELLSDQRVALVYIEAGMSRTGTQQTYLGDIDTVMQSHGYRAFKIYEQRNEWIEDCAWLRRCNVAYLSERFALANPYKLSQALKKLRNQVRQSAPSQSA